MIFLNVTFGSDITLHLIETLDYLNQEKQLGSILFIYIFTKLSSHFKDRNCENLFKKFHKWNFTHGSASFCQNKMNTSLLLNSFIINNNFLIALYGEFKWDIIQNKLIKYFLRVLWNLQDDKYWIPVYSVYIEQKNDLKNNKNIKINYWLNYCHWTILKRIQLKLIVPKKIKLNTI